MALVVTESAHPSGRLIIATGTEAEISTCLCAGTGLSNIKYMFQKGKSEWLGFNMTAVGACYFSYWTPVI